MAVDFTIRNSRSKSKKKKIICDKYYPICQLTPVSIKKTVCLRKKRSE